MNSLKLANGRLPTSDERKKLDEARYKAELAAKRNKRRETKGLTAAQRMMGERA